MWNRREAVSLLAAAFQIKPPSGIDRPWIGPQYWANPLQDWRLHDGRIECFVAGGDRNLYLLTHELKPTPGTLAMRVRCGKLESVDPKDGFIGFRIGIRGFYNDYRDSAIYGYGLEAGVTATGNLFIGNPNANGPRVSLDQPLELALEIADSGAVTLKALDATGKELANFTRADIPADALTGGIALVCHSGEVHPSPDPRSIQQTMSGANKRGWDRGGSMRFWFRDWTVSGTKLAHHPDRAWGPILFAMHTLSRAVLKMTAQLAPVEESSRPVELQVKRGAAWRTIATSRLDPLSRTAHFRVPKWNDRADTPYRVRYGDATYEGVIRHDPKAKQKLVVGALTCINDLGFPHNEITNNLKHFRPDFLAFCGDQIYERSAGYGAQRQPIEPAVLDYLRKWYIFGWSFRDALKDTPAVCLPDDHDVYHGNIWGAAGRKAEGMGQPGQDSGGYTQPAVWVNVVQRTQTSHMPDPYDPTPVDQDISVYYCDVLYGGVSFAVIEDRKWKSAPKQYLPTANIVNGWIKNPAFNAARDGDAPGAQLLGARQEQFLEDWAKNWDGAYFKVVISQTIFANVATLPLPADTDAVTPKLPIEPVGGYAKGEVPVADHDSNGWPQSGRNRALRAMRKCCAFHIAGDQHLGSTVQYGVEAWNDAGWAICVPAVSNLFPRRWYPPGGRNTGEFTDGFGNKVTVHAVFNPQLVPHEPVIVNRRAPGFGVIELDRATRKITAANWARWTDASKPGAKPVDGWPIIIGQNANGLPRSGWVLPEVKSKTRDPVVQVIDESSGEVVYTLRVAGQTFTPPAPSEGTYTVRIAGQARKGQKARRA
jgi:phosphodiesterase/alkaline phosphatase D-like protein